MTWTKFFAAFLAVQLIASPLVAQMAAGAGQRDYSIGPDVWPNFFAAYQMPDVPHVVEGNSPRLDELIHDGKLYLSLSDALALALENNLDVAVSRYTRSMAETQVRVAKTGGSVSSALGGVSSLSTGSSSTASSGVAGRVSVRSDPRSGAGNSGGTTGASGSGLNLDPTLFGSFEVRHQSRPLVNNVVFGTNSFVNDTTNSNVGVTQGFLTGATATLSWNAARSLSNSPFDNFNPSISSQVSLDFRQPLMRGFGKRLNTISLRIARNNLQASDLQFKEQLIATVSSIQELYWVLVRFRADVESTREDLRLARQLHDGNRERVRIGTTAPIDLIESEAEVSQREQQLTLALQGVRQQEATLKTALSKNGLASPSLLTVEIIPTDSVEVPNELKLKPLPELMHIALTARPDIARSRIGLENADISLEGSRNSLRPSINVFANATNNGLAGRVNSLGLAPGEDPAVSAFFVGGLGQALGQVFRRNFPDYSVGLNLSIPLRNRRAQANVTNALLARRQSQLRIQAEVNRIRNEVQDKVIGLEQAHARYLASRMTLGLREKMLEGEEQKRLLGKSDTFHVVQRQRELAQARAGEILARNEFVLARTDLDRITGQTLAVNNISLDEAYEGRVSRRPDPIPVAR